jgi:hypothetical protein
MNRRLGGLLGQHGSLGEKNNLLHLSGIEPQFVIAPARSVVTRIYLFVVCYEGLTSNIIRIKTNVLVFCK